MDGRIFFDTKHINAQRTRAAHRFAAWLLKLPSRDRRIRLRMIRRETRDLYHLIADDINHVTNKE